MGFKCQPEQIQLLQIKIAYTIESKWLSQDHRAKIRRKEGQFGGKSNILIYFRNLKKTSSKFLWNQVESVIVF